MQADQIRELFDYHITTNRTLWDTSVSMALTDEQFTQELDYSVGSIRNQCVHLMSVDERWFSGLRGIEPPEVGFLDPEQYPNREQVRSYWDQVEAEMKSYLEFIP